MAAALAEVLAVLRRERGTGYPAAHEAVQGWLDDFGEERLAERVIDAAPADAPVEDLADLFGFLVWATSDNGSQRCRTLERWLREGTDERRMCIALHPGAEFYPFMDAQEMELELSRIANERPALRARCIDLIEQRRRDAARATFARK